MVLVRSTHNTKDKAMTYTLSPDIVGEIFGSLAPPPKPQEDARQIKCFCCNDTGLIEATVFARYMQRSGVALEASKARMAIALRCRNPYCGAGEPCNSVFSGQIGYREVSPDSENARQVCQAIHEFVIAEINYYCTPEGQRHVQELRAFYRKSTAAATAAPEQGNSKPQKLVTLPAPSEPLLTEQEAVGW